MRRMTAHLGQLRHTGTALQSKQCCSCFAPRQRQLHCSRGRRKQQLVQCSSGAVLLEVKDLEARVVGQERCILNGVSLTIKEGEVHAIMGTNGSGKSTLTKVIVGHPDYEVTAGTITYKGDDLLALAPEDRARAGVFLSFQSPIEIPGVSNMDFLRLALNTKRKAAGQAEMDPLEFYAHVMPLLAKLKMDTKFLERNVNEGFSGGERKRNEILQLAVLESDLAILDEIDSGLDIDALKDVATAVNGLKREDSACLLVTHYKRLLNYIAPDVIHIMEQGRITSSGGMELADILENQGYQGIRDMRQAQAAAV